MKLHTLKPAEGSTKARKELEEVKVQAMGVPQQEDTKALNLGLDINQRLDSKVVKCHYNEEFQNLVLRT